MKRALICSIVVHLAMVMLLLVCREDRLVRVVTELELKSQRDEHFVEDRPRNAKRTSAVPSARHRAGSFTQKFVPRYHVDGPEEPSKREESDQVWQEGSAFRMAPSFIGSNENWEFYRSVYVNIDSNLIFGSELAQYSHFGSVDIRFQIHPDGTLVDQAAAIFVKSADPILKVHALRAIRKGTAQPLPTRRYFHGKDPVTILARFSFLQDDPQLNWDKQKTFGKPIFIFTRATREKPVPSTLAEHLISGGIDYDLLAAAERWKKFSQKKRRAKEQFDPFYEYRMDPDYLR